MTITLTREEAQQVLGALNVGLTSKEYRALVKTLRARLAQPESEPVAWTVGGLITDFSRDFSAYKTKTYTKPLYTTPPQAEPKPVADKYLMEVECTKCGAKQDGVLTVTTPQQRKEWQGLTDAEWETTHWSPDFRAGAKWAEAKLKEKNT